MITDAEIIRLADAIGNYIDWQQRQAELKERLRFERRIRRAKPEAQMELQAPE